MPKEHIDRNRENYDDPIETIVAYDDGGNSAIIVSEPGATVDLYEGRHKYFRSPEYDPSQKILIAGYHPESGEKVRLVIDGNYAVAFGVDKAGKQFAEVSETNDEDYGLLREPIVIGQPNTAFNGLVISSVGAEYKAFGGGAQETRQDQNPFTIADRLVERAKSHQAQ